jgi:hypothetical protein
VHTGIEVSNPTRGLSVLDLCVCVEVGVVALRCLVIEGDLPTARELCENRIVLSQFQDGISRRMKRNLNK